MEKFHAIGTSAGEAEEAANYLLLKNNGDIDAVLMPTTSVVKNNALFWYRESCVTIKGKGIKILQDEEKKYWFKEKQVVRVPATSAIQPENSEDQQEAPRRRRR